MAEQEDEVNTSRLYCVMPIEVEAIPDLAWKHQISWLEPSVRAELDELARSDGSQTYVPRAVWVLLGLYFEALDTQETE